MRQYKERMARIALQNDNAGAKRQKTENGWQEAGSDVAASVWQEVAAPMVIAQDPVLPVKQVTTLISCFAVRQAATCMLSDQNHGQHTRKGP